MHLTIIISYYKKTKNLRAILKALSLQTVKNFELVISEDDNAIETKEIIKDFSHILNIKHVFHKDDGFRKNIALNKSIKASEGKILVFIDGDCIPHKNLVKQYQKNILKKTFLIGRRVMLSEKISNKILRFPNVFKINLLKLVFSGTRGIEDGIYLPFKKSKKSKRGLCGCNWAVYKSDIIAVNGFDEDYLNPGVGEDVDIEWRLLENGCKQKSVRNKAIVYHLFHKRGYLEENVQENYRILEKKKIENNIYCKNGLIPIVEKNTR